jgi:hypothetical protein
MNHLTDAHVGQTLDYLGQRQAMAGPRPTTPPSAAGGAGGAIAPAVTGPGHAPQGASQGMRDFFSPIVNAFDGSGAFQFADHALHGPLLEHFTDALRLAAPLFPPEIAPGGGQGPSAGPGSNAEGESLASTDPAAAMSLASITGMIGNPGKALSSLMDAPTGPLGIDPVAMGVNKGIGTLTDMVSNMASVFGPTQALFDLISQAIGRDVNAMTMNLDPALGPVNTPLLAHHDFLASLPLNVQSGLTGLLGPINQNPDRSAPQVAPPQGTTAGPPGVGPPAAAPTDFGFDATAFGPPADVSQSVTEGNVGVDGPGTAGPAGTSDGPGAAGGGTGDAGD